MSEVTVLEARRTAPNSRARSRSGPISVERIRVAAYVRVSTDGDEQIGSFESQKKYYEEKIAENLEWINAGIYADEAITGTMTNKRTGFQEMISKCLDGEIDLILTKSISRFTRNTLDTLHYSRMLRDKNIGILFEKENIYTLDMQGEMLLTIMSSLAQQEVESLSKNVKMGIKMKMKRGELVGFNGCLGYDYHPETKFITVNEEEAEIVRIIFDLYLQGYGSNTIANYLTQMGKKNKKGEVSWLGHGIIGIIKNEKYKGDLLLGKTFTLDPINKRRLANMGEEDQYYIKDHHEPIVSREVWDAAQRIREKRTENRVVASTGYRERFTRQYAFSSMCECGFCGHKLSRRTRHCNSVYEKPIWHCMNATKYGIKNCPNCKAIDEAILEGAFVDMFSLLAGNYDDVLNIVMATVAEVANNPDDKRRKTQINREISDIETRKSRMTDLLIDGTISKNDYKEKSKDLSCKLNTLLEKKMALEESINKRQNIEKRMEDFRNILSNNPVLDEFDRVVFESIVDKVIVGGYDEQGTPDPYKLTFVLKTRREEIVPHAKEIYKEKKRKNKDKTKKNDSKKVL